MCTYPRISITNCVVLHFGEEPHTLHVRLSFRHFFSKLYSVLFLNCMYSVGIFLSRVWAAKVSQRQQSFGGRVGGQTEKRRVTHFFKLRFFERKKSYSKRFPKRDEFRKKIKKYSRETPYIISEKWTI